MPKVAKVSKVNVVGACEGVKLDKRFYVPGVTIETSCPRCNADRPIHLADRYLTSPTVGRPHDAMGYCPDCDLNWPVMIRVDVTVTAVDNAQAEAGEGVKE